MDTEFLVNCVSFIDEYAGTLAIRERNTFLKSIEAGINKLKTKNFENFIIGKMASNKLLITDVKSKEELLEEKVKFLEEKITVLEETVKVKDMTFSSYKFSVEKKLTDSSEGDKFMKPSSIYTKLHIVEKQFMECDEKVKILEGVMAKKELEIRILDELVQDKNVLIRRLEKKGVSGQLETEMIALNSASIEKTKVIAKLTAAITEVNIRFKALKLDYDNLKIRYDNKEQELSAKEEFSVTCVKSNEDLFAKNKYAEDQLNKVKLAFNKLKSDHDKLKSIYGCMVVNGLTVNPLNVNPPNNQWSVKPSNSQMSVTLSNNVNLSTSQMNIKPTISPVSIKPTTGQAGVNLTNLKPNIKPMSDSSYGGEMIGKPMNNLAKLSIKYNHSLFNDVYEKVSADSNKRKVNNMPTPPTPRSSPRSSSSSASISPPYSPTYSPPYSPTSTPK